MKFYALTLKFTNCFCAVLSVLIVLAVCAPGISLPRPGPPAMAAGLASNGGPLAPIPFMPTEGMSMLGSAPSATLLLNLLCLPAASIGYKVYDMFYLAKF